MSSKGKCYGVKIKQGKGNWGLCVCVYVCVRERDFFFHLATS